MHRFEIKAGERVRIFRRYGNSLPDEIRFDADAGRVVPSGTIEIEGPRPGRARPPQPLGAANSVAKTVWDSRFSIFVTPDVDVIVTLHKRVADGVPPLLWVLAGILSLGLIAGLLPLVLR